MSDEKQVTDQLEARAAEIASWAVLLCVRHEMPPDPVARVTGRILAALRKSARSLAGDKYDELIAGWRKCIEIVCTKPGINPFEAVLKIKAANPELVGDGEVLWLTAAAVEMVEGTRAV